MYFMNGEQILSTLADVADTRDIGFEDLASALASALADHVVATIPNADDSYVAIDLDEMTIVIQATSVEGDEWLLDIEDLGRRSATGVKEAVSRAVSTAQAQTLSSTLDTLAGTIQYGTVTQSGEGAAVVMLDVGIEAILPASSMVGRPFRSGTRVAVLATGTIDETGLTPRAVVVRNTSEFLKGLLAEAVPSVADGSIELRRVARRPGVRSKVLVAGTRTDSDPVALIIGSGGRTISAVADELRPERIDVVGIGTPEQMVRDALVPGVCQDVTFGSDGQVFVSVLDEDRPAVFSKEGHNVKLASALLGVKIVVVSPEAE